MQVFAPPPSPSAPAPLWSEESFLFSGEEYFRRMTELTRSARSSIRIESYIFELDAVGLGLIHELNQAAQRGVKVRLIVDAIGSPNWRREDFSALAKHGVRFRIFGRPRELVAEALRLALRGKAIRAFQTLRKFQLRNHRKLAIFDRETALVGSSNIGERFSHWRETTVELRGPGVIGLTQSFIRCWRFAARERIPEDSRFLVPQIRNNFTHAERSFVNRQFIARVRATEKRLWMTTAYFHPRPKLLLALFFILPRGIDLRILVPRHSDISWFPWLSRTAFAGLIARGAKIFEFDGLMLHAKSTLFDHDALVGSRNMNYRSFMHDLELDVALDSPKTMKILENQFKVDCESAVQVTREQLREYAPLAFLVSLGLTPFKRWL